MTAIKAAVCRAFGAPLTIETLELRAPTGREVEVTLDAVAICHSDISYAMGGWGGDLPAVYGHEAAGRISAMGPEVAGLTLGDPVVVTLIRACGTCAFCATGRPVLCNTPHAPSPLSDASGNSVSQAMACGAFAERVVVEASQVVRLQSGISMDAASLLACGVITGIGAVVNAAGLRAGQDVVVIGAGGVGLNAIQGARIAGARRIVAVDMSPGKLAMARDFGATDGVLATAEKPWREAENAMGRKADAVIVTVGVPAAYNTAPKYMANGGRLVMVGMTHTGDVAQYDPAMMAACGQASVGSKMGDVVIQRDIPWMVDLYRQGRLKLDELVSGRWRLDQINEAMADTRAGGARRNVIVFNKGSMS